MRIESSEVTAPSTSAARLSGVGVRARLALLVAVATVIWGALALLSKSPWIFADEPRFKVFDHFHRCFIGSG